MKARSNAKTRLLGGSILAVPVLLMVSGIGLAVLHDPSIRRAYGGARPIDIVDENPDDNTRPMPASFYDDQPATAGPTARPQVPAPTARQGRPAP